MAMTDAEKLFFAGVADARAAHAVVAAAQANIHMTVPFYLLLGFSIETVLKAAYLHHGGDMNVAKDKIRHDLPLALTYATDLGFQTENEHLEWLTEAMADVHRNHSFRYLTGDGILSVPDVTFSLTILDGLVAQVGQLLHPEHDRAYWMRRLAKFDPRTDDEVTWRQSQLSTNGVWGQGPSRRRL